MEILNKNNGSTIATWIAILVMIIEIISKQLGIDIPHDTVVLFATGVVTFIIAIYSSKHPNTLSILGNDQPTNNTENQIQQTDDPVEESNLILNDEYTSDEDDQQ